ncbi:hypothetical protein FK178_04950 [Antarcticibacterium arcticum]|uniref:Uncharacterized protein n=1 Tax=Antarcticibacterium arcticum TaxID=2585771 RepID=A0A5B8YJT8_9FLAO|nr:hypothetical protein [Antarcticibacterium arcticum]QED37097.1 hypothetical protein FK178_04950 [Antarcticibacterium arcticum]
MEIVKEYTLIFFAVALLFPSAVSLSHMFAHQEHEACFDFTETHYHKKTLDCELCDLRSNQLLAFKVENYQFYIPYIPKLRSTDFYQFLSDFQKLPFALRGPPAFVSA